MSKENKKSISLVGALISATGIVALGSLVASGAALGALAERFRTAGNVVKDAWKQQMAQPEAHAETAEQEIAEAEPVSAEILED